MPVACGHVYIGRTGRCFNERALVHKGIIRNKVSHSLLSRHIKECSGCRVIWDEYRILDKAKDTYERLVLETRRILDAGNGVSAPSLSFVSTVK